jgi:hypothetical protein
MSLPKKGTRSIVVGEVTYRWRVGYDGLHWDEGYLTPLSFLVQAAGGSGQLLRASLWCSRKQCDRVGENPFAPRFVRGLILVARAGDWRPLERGLLPFEVGALCSDDLAVLKHGWLFSSRDPQTGSDWLTLAEESGAESRFGTLQARVTAAIGQALAWQTGAEGLPVPRRPEGIRLLCARRPTAEDLRLLARLKTLCASYDLAFVVHTLEAGREIEIPPDEGPGG